METDPRLEYPTQHRAYDIRTYYDDELNPRKTCEECGHEYRKYLYDIPTRETEEEFGGCPKCWQNEQKRLQLLEELQEEWRGTDEKEWSGAPEINQYGVKTIKKVIHS